MKEELVHVTFSFHTNNAFSTRKTLSLKGLAYNLEMMSDVFP
jgi:hypothetical protein